MKYFRLHILARILVLTASLAAFLFLAFIAGLKASAILLAILTVAQIVNLIFYAEQTNRVLTRFFSGIRYDDFTSSLHQESKGKTFDELNTQLSNVVAHFQKIRMEKEENYRYLEQVFRHLSFPTLSIHNGEEINFINHAARSLFPYSGLRTPSQLDEPVQQAIREMKSGEKKLVRLTRDGIVLPMIISLTEFKLQQGKYQLISFQNIRREIEKTETEAWQKLIRVLTHEIMNSVTPVTTLADSLQTILFHADKQTFKGPDLTPDQTKDVQQALSIIINRSRGLLNFVESYRNLTRIPVPQLEEIPAADFLADIHKLFAARIRRENISFEITVTPENLRFWADLQLTEQVLINLVINAIQAVAETPAPKISLRAGENAFGQTEIEVKDNGVGISEEQIEDIFIPFYSTKKEGTGVGLSISRQIMQTQGGDIRVSSLKGEGATFTLTFG
ncbi:MAG: HAMP domain-containing sensor histidine kinase [Bacteroidia bacterium]